jgi:hypothetical protein
MTCLGLKCLIVVVVVVGCTGCLSFQFYLLYNNQFTQADNLDDSNILACMPIMCHDLLEWYSQRAKTRTMLANDINKHSYRAHTMTRTREPTPPQQNKTHISLYLHLSTSIVTSPFSSLRYLHSTASLDF